MTPASKIATTRKTPASHRTKRFPNTYLGTSKALHTLPFWPRTAVGYRLSAPPRLYLPKLVEGACSETRAVGSTHFSL
jgi:hypothetical protein